MARKKEVKQKARQPIFFRHRYAPLHGSFMATAIIGFLISLIYVYPISPTWGITFIIFFIVMFIASVISMTKAPVDEKVIK